MIDYSTAQIPIFIPGLLNTNGSYNFVTSGKTEERKLITARFNIASEKKDYMHPDYHQFIKRHQLNTGKTYESLTAEHGGTDFFAQQQQEYDDFPTDLTHETALMPNANICHISPPGNTTRHSIFADPEELAKAFFLAIHQNLLISIDTDFTIGRSRITMLKSNGSQSTKQPLTLKK